MNQIPYSPGLHKLVTLAVEKLNTLTSSQKFIEFSERLLTKYELEKVGISVHDFDNDSFTIAICLKESHICIHTLPEFKQLTLDVYLCNYLQENSQKVKDIMADYIAYFDATVLKDFEINR